MYWYGTEALELIDDFYSLFVIAGISLVPNTALQNALVEENVIDLIVRIMQLTDHIDVKVSREIIGERCLVFARSNIPGGIVFNLVQISVKQY